MSGNVNQRHLILVADLYGEIHEEWPFVRNARAVYPVEQAKVAGEMRTARTRNYGQEQRTSHGARTPPVRGTAPLRRTREQTVPAL